MPPVKRWNRNRRLNHRLKAAKRKKPSQNPSSPPAGGRPPKEKAVSEDKDTKAATPRRGRPPKADKAAPDKATPPKPRDKVSRSGSEKKLPQIRAGSISAAAPAQEQAPAAPTPPATPLWRRARSSI